MARIITKELALKIAKKLDATITKGEGPHDLAEVWHNDFLVASFGIRRSSEKDKGHDHIPSELFVNAYFAKLLGQCPKSRDEWIEELTRKGLIEDSSSGYDQEGTSNS